jgi:predicted S18 family serine protease
MKKLFSLLFVILVCATTAFAAAPGQVVKVDTQSITVHWQTQKSGISKHGIAGGGYGGSTRQFTFKLTPQTTYWQGGKQVTVTSIQKGATVQVTAAHGVASRIDIL